MSRFAESGRRVPFDGGEKSTEMGKKHSEVERSAQLSYERAAGFHSTRSDDASAKGFLERGDVLIEIEKFRGEKVLRSKPLGTPDSRVVLGPTGLRCSHLRGAVESPAISLYQPG